ncbi:uroporphyrinogen-III synthase [Sorangium cellulosum]|uniref:uroporphyrinogen-III synthase n=1 Tax=Sorangium cellulosum TaxID=56 RepID=UPI001010170B|nr:uroporphyrinogen-III synthase [Sorangium cellulosum]
MSTPPRPLNDRPVPTAPPDFAGRRVISFESRRATEMASLIQRHGGVPITAPALREVPIERNERALDFARRLAGAELDVVILMTGAGTRALVAEAAPALEPGPDSGGAPGGEGEASAQGMSRMTAALSSVQLVARGPKPAAALRELGLTRFLTVPEPNTWREILDVVRGLGDLSGKRIAVQEHGAPSHELYAGLEAAGARVTPVPAYRWALPEDTAPLRRALHALADGGAAITLFTSRAQVEHALLVAAEEGLVARLRERLARGVVASIGPVCTEALRAEGIEPDFEPEHPKMGHLVKAAAARSGEILARKGNQGDAPLSAQSS